MLSTDSTWSSASSFTGRPSCWSASSTATASSTLVSNSVQHSNASNGVIELFGCVTPTFARVEVSDDGDGFEPPPVMNDNP